MGRTQLIIHYLHLKYCSKTAQRDVNVTESYVISRDEPHERVLISDVHPAKALRKC